MEIWGNAVKPEVILLHLNKRWLLQPLPWASSGGVRAYHRNSVFHMTKLTHSRIWNNSMIPARREGTRSTSLGLLWWCVRDTQNKELASLIQPSGCWVGHGQVFDPQNTSMLNILFVPSYTHFISTSVKKKPTINNQNYCSQSLTFLEDGFAMTNKTLTGP